MNGVPRGRHPAAPRPAAAVTAPCRPALRRREPWRPRRPPRRRSRSSGRSTSRPTPPETPPRPRARCARSGARAWSATSRASTRWAWVSSSAAWRSSTRRTREAAEGAFRTAVELAPGLPDGHAGLAVALLEEGAARRRSRASTPRSPASPPSCRPGAGIAAAATSRRWPPCSRPSRSRGRSRSRSSPGVAACCATTSRSGWARPRTAPPRWASSCCCSSCPWRPSRGGAGCPCGGSRSSLPTSTGGRGCSPAFSSRPRSPWGRPSPRSSCGCAPRATRSSTPRSPPWSRPPTAPRSRGSRRRRGATRRIATSPTCSARPAGARADTRRRRSCTGRCSLADPRDAVARNNLANIEFLPRQLRRGARAVPGGHGGRGRRPRSRPPRTTTCRSPTSRSSSTRPTTRPSRTRTGSLPGWWPTTTGGSTTRATTRWWTSA